MEYKHAFGYKLATKDEMKEDQSAKIILKLPETKRNFW